jgi:hypothetical protein
MIQNNIKQLRYYTSSFRTFLTPTISPFLYRTNFVEMNHFSQTTSYSSDRFSILTSNESCFVARFSFRHYLYINAFKRAIHHQSQTSFLSKTRQRKNIQTDKIIPTAPNRKDKKSTTVQTHENLVL